MATANCLVTNNFKYIILCSKMKETHTGLEQVEGEEMMKSFLFRKSCLFNVGQWS